MKINFRYKVLKFQAQFDGATNTECTIYTTL